MTFSSMILQQTGPTGTVPKYENYPDNVVRMTTANLAQDYEDTLLPISLDEYSFSQNNWAVSRPRSIYRSAHDKSIWPWGGFGYVHLKPRAEKIPTVYEIAQHGFVFCSRLTLMDRVSGQILDSHLPVDHEDEGIFAYDWRQMQKYLQRQNFNLETSVATLIYGSDLKTGFKDVSGLMIARQLEKSGLEFAQIIEAPSSLDRFVLNTYTGRQSPL